MLACHLVYSTVVVYLQRHGTNPNYPSARIGRSETELMTGLTRDLRHERGASADNLTPQEIGIDRSESLTAKADYIVQLLLDAGLTFPRKRFLRHSLLKRHISPEMAQRLKNRNMDIRSLEELALLKVRNYIRFRCDGIHFCRMVNALQIHNWIKAKITFKSR